MDIITLDFETFFDTASGYTLRKMTTEAYVRDARFQAHGCAVRWANGYKEWLTPYEIKSRLVNLPDRIVLAHHAHFDGLILAHHYGLKPRGWIDTLPMARLLLGNHVKVGLESLAAHFGLGAKTVPYALMDGRQWNDMTREVQVQVLEGGKQDCELEFQLFNILAREFPAEEYGVIDATIRMFTEPKIIGDRALLAQVWQDEVEEKRVLLERLGVTVEQLRSNDAFIALLHQLDVQPEYKHGKNGPIPAFAKSDDFMRDLLEDADDTVRLLAEARLDAKSTLNETRAARLGWMATRGAMAVYINYCGAHTTRDSGGDKVNWQNFQRKHKLFPKRGRIRQAMCAPAGYRIGVVDASQIECRMLNEFSGQTDICDKFREKRDLYSELATICYGFPVTKANEAERGTGKQLELSCLGPDTQVLTRSGAKPITTITSNDQLWDGVEWVTHKGLVSRGTKAVINVAGLFLTPDHLVLCGNSWLEALSLRSASTLSQALETASVDLPLAATNLEAAGGSLPSWLHALVERRNTLLTHTIYLPDALRGATLALKKRAAIGLKNITAMVTLYPMISIDAGFSGALRQSSIGAQTNEISVSTITEGAVLNCTSLGIIVKHFSNTLANFQDGMIQFWNWIGAIMLKGMSLETSNSSPTKSIHLTGGHYKNSKLLVPTYDIRCAGPRNRFTVVSAAGPLIVHNCGYGAGDHTIMVTAKKGTYGPPVVIDINKAREWKEVYRGTHQQVVAQWRYAGDVLKWLATSDLDFMWGPLRVIAAQETGRKRIILPNGAPLIYDTLEWHVPEEIEQSEQNNAWDHGGYWRIRTRRGYAKMYGAKLIENVIQALARVHLMQVMLKLRASGLFIWLRAHDELGFLIEANAHQDAWLQFAIDTMRTPPAWMPNVPLDAEGIISERYEK